MTRCIYRWFVPNRVDRQILAVFFVYLLAAGITAIEGNWYIDPSIRLAIVYGFFGALFSVPATIGTQSWTDIRRSIPVLLLTLMSLGLILILVDWDLLWNSWDSNRNLSFINGRLVPGKTIFLNYFGFLILVAAYVGTLLVSTAFSRTVDRLLQIQWIRKQNRVRLLICFVVFLFICSQLQTLLKWYSVEFNPVLVLIGGAVLLIPATWLLCRLQRWWLRIAVFSILFGAIALLQFGMPSPINRGGSSIGILMLVAPFGYFVVLMLIWRPVSIGKVEQEIAIPGRRWPSLWGLGAIGTAILIVVASSLVELMVAFQFGGSDGLEVARFVRRLQQTSGVVTHHQIEGNNESLAAGIPINFGVMAGFSPKSDPNYFAGFADLTNPVMLNLRLYNMNPNVKTDGIKGVQKQFVWAEGGRLSTQQLFDLIFNCQWVYVSGCQFENSGINLKPDSNQSWPLNITLHSIPPGQSAIAVNALQTAGFSGTLQLHSCELNDDDWRAIGGLQNASSISIHECSPPTSIATRKWLKEIQANQSRIQLVVPRDETSRGYWSYFDLNIRISAGRPPFDTDGETWDALFIGGLKLGNSEEFLDKLLDYSNFKRYLVDFHLVFDPEKNPEAIRYALIPILSNPAVEKAASLTDLEILSFDTDWFNDSLKRKRDLNDQTLNFQPLEKLQNLKELYFPRGVYIDNFEFFAKLPNLEILQFDAFHDSRLYTVPKVKAEFFPSLKRIRLFSEPHPKLLLELSKLGNLERIDLIDSKDWFEKTEDQEELKSIFDKRVEIRFLKIADYPDPPESFRQHLKQVEQDVRKRRLPGSESDADR